MIIALALLAGGGGLAWLATGGGGTAPAVQDAQAAQRPAPAAFAAAKLRPELFPTDLVTARGPVPRGGFSPPLTAEGAILVDLRTGRVLWAHHEHERLPIASTTKILTAAIALQLLAPRDVVRIAPAVPRVPPFREGLRTGERVPAWKLFYALLLYSGNDDALALAIGAAGNERAFLALMNRRVHQLGLRNSHFTSPSGVVDKGNFSTAWDLATITRYAMQNPRFRGLVRTRVKRVSWAPPTYSKIYVNKNHLLGSYPGADGVKTGWTTIASHCLVASAHRGKVGLLAIVLHASDPYGDVRRLLDYGFANRG